LDEDAKPNHGCSRQRYHVGIFILHPRHHRGYGWHRIHSRTMKRGIVVSILVLHVPLGDISLSIYIWIELITPQKINYENANTRAHDGFHMVVLARLRRCWSYFWSTSWREKCFLVFFGHYDGSLSGILLWSIENWIKCFSGLCISLSKLSKMSKIIEIGVQS
jgi:hypothetical protein